MFVYCVQKNVFSKKPIEENADFSYVPSKPLYSEQIKSVCCNTDRVVEGAFTKEKEDVFTAIAARSITEGKSMLVVTDDMEMSQ